MFDSGMERTIIGSAIVLWFAHGWCLNTRLRDVHRKLGLILVNVWWTAGLSLRERSAV
jgi:hypothetical protein